MWILFLIILGVMIINITFEILSDMADGSTSGIGKAFNTIVELITQAIGLVFVLAGFALFLGFFYVLISIFTH